MKATNGRISAIALRMAVAALREDIPDIDERKLAAILAGAEITSGEELLTVQEAAEWLRISRDTLYRLLKAHKTRVVKVGCRTRIRRRDLDAMVDVGPVRSQAELNLSNGRR